MFLASSAGFLAHHIYEDLASGKDDERPGFIAACKSLRAGEILVAYKLDKLARNLKHLWSTQFMSLLSAVLA